MTAETLSSAQVASSTVTRRSGGSGVVHYAYGTYDIAANVEDGDIFEMVKLPPNSRILGGWVYADDMDTNASEALDMDIGWAANGGTGTYDTADVDGLGNLGVWVGDAFATPNIAAASGNVIPLQGKLSLGECPKFTKETTIQIEANVAAATFAAGTVSVVVLYGVENAAS